MLLRGAAALTDPRLYPPELLAARLHHLGLPRDIYRYALLPAHAPTRLTRLGALLDTARQLNPAGEEPVYGGELASIPTLVLHSGIGGPNVALTLETLAYAGVTTCIRVGSAGGLQNWLSPGDLVNASAAIRGDGASAEYVAPEYPAAADPHLVHTIAVTARRLPPATRRCYTGLIWSHDAFFAETPRALDAWRQRRALAAELESGTLFTLARLRGLRAASVLTITDVMPHGRSGGSVFTDPALHATFEAGVERMLQLVVDVVKQDAQRTRPP